LSIAGLLPERILLKIYPGWQTADGKGLLDLLAVKDYLPAVRIRTAS